MHVFQSYVLCNIFTGTARSSFPINFFKGKNVVELGSGLGLMGVVMSYLDVSNIYLSDISPLLLNHLKRNVKFNVHPSLFNNIHFLQLLWGSEDVSVFSSKSIDVIVGCDILYNFRVYSDLFRTIERICNYKNEVDIILAYEERQPTHEKTFLSNFQNNSQLYFTVTKVEFDIPDTDTCRFYWIKSRKKSSHTITA